MPSNLGSNHDRVYSNQMELRELFVSGANGDSQRYLDFLTAFSKILRVLLAKTLPASDVDDVIQEILASVHSSRHTYDHSRPIGPWLFSITRFRIADQLRKIYFDKRCAAEIERLAEDTVRSVEISSATQIQESLRELPERQQTIIKLLYFDGFSASEAGDRLGMTESAIKVAAHRAIKKLRAGLLG